jgi:hypothetical protein
MYVALGVSPPRGHLQRGDQTVKDHRLRLNREGSSYALDNLRFVANSNGFGAK